MFQAQDSIASPNVIDTLRRVSLVFAKHIGTGEKWRADAFLSARAIVSRDLGGEKYSKRDLHRYLSRLPQWDICRRFSQCNFMSPQWTYDMSCSMMAGPIIAFAGHAKTTARVVPDAKSVALYLGAFVSALELDAENLIIGLIYVERMMRLTDMHLLSDTWRPLLLTGLLTATKIWQDNAPPNKAFSVIFPEFPTKAISKLERLFATELDWKFSVSGSEYASYYFSLRSLSQVPDAGGPKRNFRRRLINHLKLDVPSARQFEEKMRAKQGKPINIPRHAYRNDTSARTPDVRGPQPHGSRNFSEADTLPRSNNHGDESSRRKEEKEDEGTGENANQEDCTADNDEDPDADAQGGPQDYVEDGRARHPRSNTRQRSGGGHARREDVLRHRLHSSSATRLTELSPMPQLSPLVQIRQSQSDSSISAYTQSL